MSADEINTLASGEGGWDKLAADIKLASKAIAVHGGRAVHLLNTGFAAGAMISCATSPGKQERKLYLVFLRRSPELPLTRSHKEIWKLLPKGIETTAARDRVKDVIADLFDHICLSSLVYRKKY